MANADLLKSLFLSHQKRDDGAFRAYAEEIIAQERKKHHYVLANELERILRNGSSTSEIQDMLTDLDPVPQDADRRTPLLEIKRPGRYRYDLVLHQRTWESVERVMEEFRGWDILEVNGLLPVRRVLFCGPSGCGKTVTAEAVATELGLPLLYVRFDAVVSSLLGETAANIRKVFEYARRGQWVIMFDEFDAIARSRDDVTEHGEIKRVVNSFLQIMDSFDGRSLIIAATNFEQALDPAVWRRFDEVVRFDKPDYLQLELLIGKKLKPLKFSAHEVQYLANGLAGGTFADAERVCVDIRKAAALRGERDVTDAAIAEALARHQYRHSVLEKASDSNVPLIDKE